MKLSCNWPEKHQSKAVPPTTPEMLTEGNGRFFVSCSDLFEVSIEMRKETSPLSVLWSGPLHWVLSGTVNIRPMRALTMRSPRDNQYRSNGGRPVLSSGRWNIKKTWTQIIHRKYQQSVHAAGTESSCKDTGGQLNRECIKMKQRKMIWTEPCKRGGIFLAM